MQYKNEELQSLVQAVTTSSPEDFGSKMLDLFRQNQIELSDLVNLSRDEEIQNKGDFINICASLWRQHHNKNPEQIAELTSAFTPFPPELTTAQSDLAKKYLSENLTCDYPSFKIIAQGITQGIAQGIAQDQDEERTEFVIKRALTITDLDAKYDFFLEATKDELTYSVYSAHTSLAASYFKCDLPVSKSGDFCLTLHQTDEELRTNLFETMLNTAPALGFEEAFESIKTFIGDIHSPTVAASIFGSVSSKLLELALMHNPNASNELCRAWGKNNSKFLFGLLGDATQLENYLTAESLTRVQNKYKNIPDLATLVYRESLDPSLIYFSFSQNGEQSINEKSLTLTKPPYILSSERDLLQSVLPRTANVGMTELTAYFKNKIGNIPSVNPAKIGKYEINFDDLLILEKRAKLNKKFSRILAKEDEEISAEEIADFCKIEWAEDKKLDRNELTELRNFFVKNKKILAALFSQPEQFSQLMAISFESCQQGEIYLNEQVEKLQLQPLTQTNDYQINFEEPKFVTEKREKINEKFKALLRSQSAPHNPEFQNAVTDFFETSLAVEINPKNRLKLAEFFFRNRDNMAYLFQQQGKFESFLHGCVGSLEMGCVANIGTQANIAFAEALIGEDPQAQIIYSVFANKICTQLLNSTGNDELGFLPSGVKIFDHQAITSSSLNPASFIHAVQNEFVSEAGNVRDPWVTIKADRMAPDKLRGLLEQKADNAVEPLKLELDRLTTEIPTDELLEINQKIPALARKVRNDKMAADEESLRQLKNRKMELLALRENLTPEQEEFEKLRAEKLKIADQKRKEIETTKSEIIQGNAAKIATYITLQKSLPQILRGSLLKTEVEGILREGNYSRDLPSSFPTDLPSSTPTAQPSSTSVSRLTLDYSRGSLS